MFAMRRFSAATALSLSMLLLGSGAAAAAAPNAGQTGGPNQGSGQELSYEDFAAERCDLETTDGDGAATQANFTRGQKPKTEEDCKKAHWRYKRGLDENRDDSNEDPDDDGDEWSKPWKRDWHKRYKHHRGYDRKDGYGKGYQPRKRHNRDWYGNDDGECEQDRSYQRSYRKCGHHDPYRGGQHHDEWGHKKWDHDHEKRYRHDSDSDDLDPCKCRGWDKKDWDGYTDYESGRDAHKYMKKARHHDHKGDEWNRRSKRFDKKADRNWKRYESYEGRDWKKAEYRSKAKTFDRRADECAERADRHYHKADYNEDEAEELIELLEFLLKLLKQHQESRA